MTNNIANLYTSLTGVKQDFKLDWKEDAKADWKVDWAYTAISLPAGHVAISNTVAPAITGTAAAGNTLTCSQGTWLGTPTPTFAYQWFSSYSGQIAGATSATYVIQNADVFATLTCQVVATNSDGSAAVRSAGVVVQETAAAPTNTALPTISGEALIDTMLTAHNGTWAGFPTPSYTYQWSSNSVAIPNATDSTYLTQQSDATFNVTVAVTATNMVGTATVSSANFGPIASTPTAPVNTVQPAMTGTAKVGMPLFISNGTWTGIPAPTFTYAWSSSATGVIPDQTTSEYLCQSTDAGNIISAIVTAYNESGNVSITVAAAPAVAPEFVA